MKSVNDKFFDDLTEEKAQYVLGFLAADGCLSTNPKKKVSFSSNDREILEKIALAMKTDYKVGHDGRSTYQLQIYSDKLFDRSLELGIPERKSLIMKYPSWATKDFVRGFFDGDGSVFKHQRTHCIYCNFITGSREFAIGLEEHLKVLGLEGHHRKDDRNYYKVCVYKKSDIFKLQDIMYKDATIYLNRKLNIFQKWLQKTSNIGEHPEKDNTETLYLEGRRDYQEVPLGEMV